MSEMDALFRRAAGKGRVVAMAVPSGPSQEMNTRIRQAAGRGPAMPEIPEDADGFTRAAMTLGVPADLVEVARGLVDDGLSGAALESSLRRAIDERPGLASPGYTPPERPDGLDGGVRTRIEPEEAPGAFMDRALRVAAGREAPRAHRYSNGIIE